MTNDMFYCKPWDDTRHKVIVNGYTIIVSDLVWGNAEHTSMQIHAVIKKGKEAAKISDFSGGNFASKRDGIIEAFESKIRHCVYSRIRWQKGALDNNLVKIWYYRKEGDLTSDENGVGSDLYFRVAITALNIITPDELTEKLIVDDLSLCLKDFVLQNIMI